MRRSRLLYTLGFVAFAAWSVGVKLRLLEQAHAIPGLERGTMAPPFKLSTLGGEELDLDATVKNNEFVLVTFWATWCGPCQLELPQLEKLYGELHGQGLEILAISSESPEDIRAFLSERPLSFPVLLDTDGLVAERYGVEALPTAVLIDRQGNVADTRTGLAPFFAQQVAQRFEQRPKQHKPE